MKTLKSAAAASAAVIALSVGAVAPNAWGSTSHKVSPTTVKYKIVTYNFNAAYNGKITILWSDTGLSKASLTGVGSKVNYGFTAVSGSGSASATSQSVPASGTGTLSGKGEVLHLKFSGTATSTAGSAPATVILSGNATVTSGAGKFAGATGVLKINGAFNIQNTSGSEKDNFSATLKGAVKVKVAVK